MSLRLLNGSRILKFDWSKFSQVLESCGSIVVQMRYPFNLRAAQQRKNAMLTVGTEGGMAATKFTRLVAGASEWPEPMREAARAERVKLFDCTQPLF